MASREAFLPACQPPSPAASSDTNQLGVMRIRTLGALNMSFGAEMRRWGSRDPGVQGQGQGQGQGPVRSKVKDKEGGGTWGNRLAVTRFSCEGPGPEILIPGRGKQKSLFDFNLSSSIYGMYGRPGACEITAAYCLHS